MSEKSLILSRVSAFTLLAVFAFLFQTCFATDLSIYGVVPSILIPCAILVGMTGGIRTGMIFGVMLGLLCDATTTRLFGYYALILLFAGFIAGFLIQSTLWDTMTAAFVIYIGFYMVMIVVAALVVLLVGSGLSYLGEIARDLLLQMAYSFIFIPPVFYLCREIRNRYYKED
ncbi:MAG: rod shape-determining protein MreD [Bacillota bacterium]|nr:rod shape-determining protein MreD [Bacillota bacterium]